MDKYSIRKLTEMSLTEQKSKLVDIVFLKGFSKFVEGDKSSTIQTIIEKKHSKMMFAVCLKLRIRSDLSQILEDLLNS